ncbi:hypothetical protein ILUMI_15349 [Ignelater luminosus]|uniref:Uncharacterized protein n=1 Tax=Ignelater luminosus TaxID=2038154 RepID=A0A8K0CQN7_IGNLU|nr:hypothetical protein ILUMI_15349 [Ignelater luminosus]
MLTGNSIYCPNNYTDCGEENNGAWRDELTPLESVGKMSANVSSRELYNLRDTLVEFFTDNGSVPWQMQMIGRGRILT